MADHNDGNKNMKTFNSNSQCNSRRQEARLNAESELQNAEFASPVRASSRRLLLRVFLAVLNTSLSGTLSAQAQTDCGACWSTVTNWQGTYSLSVVGGPSGSGWSGQVNNSSQGSFWITNGVHAVHGSGSIDSTAVHSGDCIHDFYDSCSAGSSGSLDAGGRVGVIIDAANCQYTLIIGDVIGNITVNNTFCGGSSQQSALGIVSCDLAQPTGQGLGVLPYFPLPAPGEHLTGSGSYPATSAATGCYSFGQYTLTLSWDIQPLIDNSPPRFTQLPTGGALGCNPANTPDGSAVLDGTTATAGSGSVSLEVGSVDVTNGCTVTRSFTITATDDCSQEQAHALVAYWWTLDTTPPTFTQLPPGGYLGTNPPTVPDDATVTAMTQASDNCGVASITVTHVDTSGSPTNSRTFTITATDHCGNVTPVARVVYTWTGTPGIGVVGAPLLHILESGSKAVVYWPTNASGFSLQARTNLVVGSSWSAVTNMPAVVGDQFMVTNTPTGPSRFYRLVK
jgi:hypothetical protein